MIAAQGPDSCSPGPPTPNPSADGALSTRAHVFVVIVTLLSIVFIIRLVRSNRLRSKYSLLWIVVALALATVAVFPGLLDRVSRAAGVYYPPATFLLLAVGFLFLIVVHFSWEFSRSEERIRTLAEDVALLQAAHDAAIAALRDGQVPPERLPTELPDATAPGSSDDAGSSGPSGSADPSGAAGSSGSSGAPG
jgi:hypothetical protein